MLFGKIPATAFLSMNLLDIVLLGDPRLYEKCEPVKQSELEELQPIIDGMANVAADSRGQTVAELAGDTAGNQKKYVLALTANTVGSAAGTIHVDYKFYTIG